MTQCTSCGAPLETPLACVACGVLFSVEPPPTPFEALGVEPTHALDVGALRKRLLRFSRMTHPDYFGTASAEARELAEINSATLNAAFELLSDDFRRYDWLVGSLGGPSETDERQMPKVFLMEVLEWNEALEEARGSAPGSEERAALSELERELSRRRTETMGAIAGLLSPLPDEKAPALAEVRRQLNAVRYLDRALRELKSLRLEEAAAG